jgi:hypothetical protein
MEPATEAERIAELREQCRLSDLRDLRGPEFLRLLSLARSEGLLDELIRDNVSLRHQAECRRPLLGVSGPLRAPETQSNSRLFADRGRQQDACRLHSEESSFPSVPSAFQSPLSEGVTEAMMASGVEVLDRLDNPLTSESLVSEVFRAMVRASEREDAETISVAEPRAV